MQFLFIGLMLFIIPCVLGDDTIECFGLKCPPGSVACLYEEQSDAVNSTIIGVAKCLNSNNEVVLRGRTTTLNPKGGNILNRYKFYGPGLYDKERINYKEKIFNKRMNLMEDTYNRRFEELLGGKIRFGRDVHH